MVKFQPVWKEVESVSQLKILELLWVVDDKGLVSMPQALLDHILTVYSHGVHCTLSL